MMAAKSPDDDDDDDGPFLGGFCPCFVTSGSSNSHKYSDNGTHAVDEDLSLVGDLGLPTRMPPPPPPGGPSPLHKLNPSYGENNFVLNTSDQTHDETDTISELSYSHEYHDYGEEDDLHRTYYRTATMEGKSLGINQKGDGKTSKSMAAVPAKRSRGSRLLPGVLRSKGNSDQNSNAPPTATCTSTSTSKGSDGDAPPYRPSKSSQLKNRVHSLSRSGSQRLRSFGQSLPFSSRSIKDEDGEDNDNDSDSDSNDESDKEKITAEIEQALGIERSASPFGALTIHYVKTDGESEDEDKDEDDVDGASGDPYRRSAGSLLANIDTGVYAAQESHAPHDDEEAEMDETHSAADADIQLMRARSRIDDKEWQEPGDVGADQNDPIEAGDQQEEHNVPRSSTMTQKLRSRVGSFKRVGSKLGRKASFRQRKDDKEEAERAIEADLQQTLGISGTYQSVEAHDDDEDKDDVSSMSDTSSARLRRVVDVENRVRSQIALARSFGSQHSSYSHHSYHSHQISPTYHQPRPSYRGREEKKKGFWGSKQSAKKQKPQTVILDLGGDSNLITRELDTAEGVKKFVGMPLFNEKGIYDDDEEEDNGGGTILPARSTDESVVFVEAPPTDPFSSGLVASDYDVYGDDLDTSNGNHGDETKRPLDFLRKMRKRKGKGLTF